MASGTPVAASGTTSCPEVGGEAAVYFDPLNVDTIVEALDHILTDSDFRTKLSKEGREWAGRFSWDKTAMRTIQVYNKLV
jgi:glycosyltransferase involved in cell wall biosynthesis